MRLVLSEQADVPVSAPLFLKVCDGKNCQRIITFSGQGRGSVFLGGTAQPAPTQRAGSYSGTITLNLTAFP